MNKQFICSTNFEVRFGIIILFYVCGRARLYVNNDGRVHISFKFRKVLNVLRPYILFSGEQVGQLLD